MWHASVAYHGARRSRQAVESERFERAFRALRAVGDARLGQWCEQTDMATHLRRRLSIAEAEWFTVRDIRGTAEAEARWLAIPRWIREQIPPHIVAEELVKP